MKQTSLDSDLRNLEQKMQNELATFRQSVELRFQPLEAPKQISTEFTASPNYLPNSHPDFSKDAYLNTGVEASDPGDNNRECYNWYYQETATTLLSTSVPLLASGHSGFAALNSDAPIWDHINGTFNIGGSSKSFDIACPLPTNFISPGRRFYVYAEFSFAASIALPDSLQFYCGFWDNTVGQEKWIEGDDFAITSEVFGAEGTRTLEYQILAETDSGTQILSDILTITTAPDALSASNHIRLFFDGAPGFIYYGIYRKDGSTYRLVHEVRNSIDLQFFDMQEMAGAVVDAFPSITTTRPQAYAITQEFEPGELSTTDYTSHTLTIQTPLTYDSSNTTNGNQWFRFGLDELLGAGDERGIVIRRISVSEGYGGWVRSGLDLSAKSSPTSTAASAPVSGNPTIDPPSPGSGGINCVGLDTEVERIRSEVVGGQRVEVIEKIEIKDVVKGDLLACGAFSLPVQKTRTGVVQFVYELETENGLSLTCSESHRLITSRFDKQGKAVKFLNTGDYVLTCKNGVFETSKLIKKMEILGETVVKSLQLPSPHLFLTNGFVSHNRKADPDL